MTTISFKAKDEFKNMLELLADRKGINMSTLIKLLLTEALNEQFSQTTENGMTLAEEMSIIQSDMEDEVSGPFKAVSGLKKALSK